MIWHQIKRVVRDRASGYTKLPLNTVDFPRIVFQVEITAHQRQSVPTPCKSRRCFSSRSNQSPPTNNLSRTERRALIRKERNATKRQMKQQRRQQGQPSSSFVPSQILNHFQSFSSILRKWTTNIHFPGRDFQKDHWLSILHRLPLFIILSYCTTDENITPYAIKASLGPSMLPTIQFCGDVWLVETGAWTRAWNDFALRFLVGGIGATDITGTSTRSNSNNNIANNARDHVGNPKISPTQYNNNETAAKFILKHNYVVGDLLLWEDTRTGRVSCKRLIGKEGDVVKIYGQYAPNIYQNRPDLGIIWPSDAKDRGLDPDPNSPKSWDTSDAPETTPPTTTTTYNEGQTAPETISRREMVVPKGCIWLEGDCPLFSVDSRQYGPIPEEQIRGRLMFRLWPWKRPDLLGYDNDDNAYLSSCKVHRHRPTPYPNAESYLGRRFGFYRVQKEEKEQEQDEK